MGASERRKGRDAELEVRDVFRAFDFEIQRTPNSGGLHLAGDLICTDGALDSYHFEIKRRETWDVPGFLRQAHEEAEGRVPVVAMRKSATPANGPAGRWHAVIPLEELVHLLAIRRSLETAARLSAVPGPVKR